MASFSVKHLVGMIRKFCHRRNKKLLNYQKKFKYAQMLVSHGEKVPPYLADSPYNGLYIIQTMIDTYEFSGKMLTFTQASEQSIGDKIRDSRSLY